jgi:thymidylate kinase
MIIVEGADNVGKSTLVQQLLEADPTLRFLDRPRFKPEHGETIGDSYLRALLPPAHDYAAQAHSIADRFLASECIYGQLFRGGCRMTADQHLILRGLLIQYNAIVVWCNPPLETISQTWREREQLYDETASLSIAASYRERIHDIFRGFPIVPYDWTKPGASVLRQTIIMAHKLHRVNQLFDVTCNILQPNEP